ncbi:MAG: hypothetical protein GWN16_04965 [Calditrichae bacterium]|nr:hypothetical protein [Calditrichia bacterium]NIV71838.1 hypothetical protein [Calditrichia bacterium]NIW78835.1 hypothetical protein [Calditrichia bacterium]
MWGKNIFLSGNLLKNVVGEWFEEVAFWNTGIESLKAYHVRMSFLPNGSMTRHSFHHVAGTTVWLCAAIAQNDKQIKARLFNQTSSLLHCRSVGRKNVSDLLTIPGYQRQR